MPPHKTHKPHVVKLYRGRPVQGRERKRTDGALRTRGRMPADPDLHGVAPEETTSTFVRSTWDERRAWDKAAAIEAGTLTEGRELTIGPWARRVLNREAKRIALEAEQTPTE